MKLFPDCTIDSLSKSLLLRNAKNDKLAEEIVNGTAHLPLPTTTFHSWAEPQQGSG